MNAILGFPDRELERSYRFSSRQVRAKSIQYVVLLGVIILSSYFFLNPRYLTNAGVIDFNNASLWILFILISYYLCLRTDFYCKTPALDLVVFIPASIAMAFIARALSLQSGENNWGPIAIITGNAQVLIPFAVIGFVASTRWFIAWSAFEVAAYLVNVHYAPAGPNGIFLGITGLLSAVLVAIYTNYVLDTRSRELYLSMRDLVSEKSRTEDLLYNVLPQFAAERLRAGLTVADTFSEATVVFIDIVGSSALAKTLSPTHFVSILNRFFLLADRCASDTGVEKVKTIGDAYLAITGTNFSGKANEAIAFSKAVIAGVHALSRELDLGLDIRIGIHSGPVIGGVIGELRMAYDYWGDTMNVASRIQSAADIGGIAVSRQTYYLTRDAHQYAAPRTAVLKGIGALEIFDAVLVPASESL